MQASRTISTERAVPTSVPARRARRLRRSAGPAAEPDQRTAARHRDRAAGDRRRAVPRLRSHDGGARRRGRRRVSGDRGDAASSSNRRRCCRRFRKSSLGDEAESPEEVEERLRRRLIAYSKYRELGEALARVRQLEASGYSLPRGRAIRRAEIVAALPDRPGEAQARVRRDARAGAAREALDRAGARLADRVTWTTSCAGSRRRAR